MGMKLLFLWNKDILYLSVCLSITISIYLNYFRVNEKTSFS